MSASASSIARFYAFEAADKDVHNGLADYCRHRLNHELLFEHAIRDLMHRPEIRQFRWSAPKNDRNQALVLWSAVCGTALKIMN
jgi:hypothetical protein